MSHEGHSHAVQNGRKLRLSLAVTLLFCIGEAVAGWLSHSLALLSDAGHNLSDAIALGLAAYAAWMIRKPATAKHTYGYHRSAILTALFNAATLVVIALFIGVEAVRRFAEPQPISGTLMIWVAAIAVVMNTVIAAALSGDAKASLNNRAAFIHMAGDAISSLGVVITGIVIHYTGWLYADPLVSALIAGFILYSAVGIVREATNILMENAPKDVDMANLVTAIKEIAPVQHVHDLHVWTVGDGLNMLSCHVILPSTVTLADCNTIICKINERLRDFSIGHATIQAETDSLCRPNAIETPYCAMNIFPEAHNHDHDHSHSH